MSQTKRRNLKSKLKCLIENNFLYVDEHGKEFWLIPVVGLEELTEKLADAAFPEKSLSQQQRMVSKCAEVMGMEIALVGGARLAKLAQDLLRAGSSPEELEDLYMDKPGGEKCVWHLDWRGKGGGFPNERNIRETLGVLRRQREKQRAPIEVY